MARTPPRMGRDKTLNDLEQPFKPNRDPQVHHVDQMEGVDDDDVGVLDDEDQSTTASSEGTEDDDPKVKVEILGAGHFYNNHPLSIGHVIELPASEVDVLRERGYRLGPVDADDERTPYDHTTEWQHPGNEKADKQDA